MCRLWNLGSHWNYSTIWMYLSWQEVQCLIFKSSLPYMQNDFFFTKNDFNMKNKWIRFYIVGQRKFLKSSINKWIEWISRIFYWIYIPHCLNFTFYFLEKYFSWNSFIWFSGVFFHGHFLKKEFGLLCVLYNRIISLFMNFF